jgi:hypothetical protein
LIKILNGRYPHQDFYLPEISHEAAPFRTNSLPDVGAVRSLVAKLKARFRGVHDGEGSHANTPRTLDSIVAEISIHSHRIVT